MVAAKYRAVRHRFNCTKKCIVDPIFHANWRERHDFTAKHLSTQQRTADHVFHANWKERPDFTAGYLKTQKCTTDGGGKIPSR